MKYFYIFTFLFVFSGNVFSYDTFFCVDGPLRIRTNPDISSKQVGSLNLYDQADILEKTNSKLTIDGIEDYWYRIKTNSIEGYVFGGYGIVIKEKYEVKTIDDFDNIFPEKIAIEKLGRYLFVPDDKAPTVTLNYGGKFMNHVFNVYVYFRPGNTIDVDKLSKELNLEIIKASNGFGRGDSYKLLSDNRYSDQIVTKYGNSGRYFFSDWGSSVTYDIANFLFETDFANIFNGILISPFNLWTDINDKRIMEINNKFINEAKTNRIKEAILFQIFYEVALRINILK